MRRVLSQPKTALIPELQKPKPIRSRSSKNKKSYLTDECNFTWQGHMTAMNKKIIDSFLYFNEFEMLQLRIKYLEPYVDYFLIIESDCDFSGKKKRFNLIDKLNEIPATEKIIYQPLHINLDSIVWKIKKLRYFYSHKKFLWKIQDAQRNAIKNYLIKNTQSTFDYILFGDIDEIPNLQIIKNLINGNLILNSPHVLKQHLFYYNLDTKEPGENWFGTICSSTDEFIHQTPSKLRKHRKKLPAIHSGGYHFSYFMHPELIKRKIEAIADCERLSHFKKIAVEEISNKINLKTDLYNRSASKFEKSDIYIPENIIELMEKYLPHAINGKY